MKYMSARGFACYVCVRKRQRERAVVRFEYKTDISCVPNAPFDCKDPLLVVSVFLLYFCFL